MEAIEKAIGKKITRIETNDLEVMEEVRDIFTVCNAFLMRWRFQNMKKALK